MGELGAVESQGVLAGELSGVKCTGPLSGGRDQAGGHGGGFIAGLDL